MIFDPKTIVEAVNGLLEEHAALETGRCSD